MARNGEFVVFMEAEDSSEGLVKVATCIDKIATLFI